MKQNYFKKSSAMLLVVCGLLSSIWATAQVNFKVEDILASSGEVIEIPITVKNFTEITAFELGIQIPADKATFVNITNVNAELGVFQDYNYNYTVDGLVQILWGDLAFLGKTIPDDEILFTIEMEVITQEEAFEINLDVSNASNTTEIISTTKESGSVSVDALLFAMEDQTVGVGTTFEIPVKAKNFLDVAGFQLKINFPEAFANFVSIIDVNTNLTGFGTQNYYAPEAGLVNVVWDEPGLINTTIDQEEILFVIQLQAANTAGTFTVDVTNTSVFDNEPKNIFSIDSQAEITIKEFVTVSGIVKNEAGEGVAKTAISLSKTGDNQEMVSNDDGTFSFTALPGDNYELTPTREQEVYNGINVADILIVRQHILGQTSLSPYKIIAADVDNSLAVNVADIINTRKLLLGETTSFYTNWVFTPESYSFLDSSNPLSETYPNTISYTPLEGAKVDQNFIAIKIGDVNDDHDVLKRGGGNLNTALAVTSKSVFSGNEVRVPVTVKEGYTNIAGWQSTIEFDQSVLSFSRMESGALSISTANYGTQKTSEGKVSFVYDQQTSKGEYFKANETLFYVVFDVIGKADEKSTVSFTSKELPMMTFSEELVKGELIVDEATIEVASLEVSIFPNPGTLFNLQFVTTKANTLKWKVLYASGITVFKEEKSVSKGVNKIEFNANDLAKGIYFLHYEIGNEQKTKKIIVN